MKTLVTAFAALTICAPAVALAAGQDAHANHAATAPASVEGTGVVRAINAKAGTITVAHEPIAALKWPAMTMPFKVADRALLTKAKVGAKVRFKLQGQKIVSLETLG